MHFRRARKSFSSYPSTYILCFTKGFKPCKDEKAFPRAQSTEVAEPEPKPSSSDNKFYASYIWPHYLGPRIAQQYSPSVSVHLQDSWEHWQTPAKTLLEKRKGTWDGSWLMDLREPFQIHRSCYGLKSLGTSRSLKPIVSHGSPYLLIINH